MNDAKIAPPLTVTPVFADRQTRREIPKTASRPFQFYGSESTSSGHFVPKPGEGRGLSYTPCLLTKPALRLRLHATQSQPCFPAASNVLALSCGNRIFAATPTERITHYTLQAKSCAKGIPFGNPILSECVSTLPPKCKISGIGQPVPGAALYRLFAYMGFLLYRPYKPFQFITSVCTVDLLMPNFFAVSRTVALVWIINCATATARSSI